MKLRIVALDTTSEHGSLALLEDGLIVEEVALHAPDGFGHLLFPALSTLMERHGWAHESVTGYAAGAGPGSFTGVRVGLAAVKGLAEAAGTKAAGVSNLRAMASYGSAAIRAPFYDARRNEIYGGVFDASLNGLRDEVVSPLERWLSDLPKGDVELMTPDPALFEAALQRRQVTATPRALAGAIARIAMTELTDPAAIDANYVRRSDAELHWKDHG